jgi:AcrR family transcriptional regulator
MAPARPTRRPKKPRTKAAYHHGNLQRALLDAALALVEESGMHGFTLREAARRAGVSQAAPYRHYADKAALLTALAEEGFRALSERMSAEVAASPASAAIVAAGTGYLLFAAENPAHYRVMFGPGLAKDAPPCATNVAGRGCFQVLFGAVEQGQRVGAVRAGDTNEIALIAWSVVHGLASLVIDGLLPELRNGADAGALRALAARMLGLFFEGLAARNVIRRAPTRKGP